MRSFRYLLDPLCLVSCSAYILNRWLIKPHVSCAFLHGHFNDLLLIPAALPPLLWLQRRMDLRSHDSSPTASEILGHLLIWSLICEGIGPFLVPYAVADWADLAAYCAGAAFAFLFWTWRYQPGFDSLADCYNLMENVLAGNRMNQCRTAFLNQIPAPRKALIMGEGHGRFLKSLLERYPDTRVTCIEKSPNMISVTLRRLKKAGISIDRVGIIKGDVRDWQPEPGAGYDLIATHFFLDCFPPDELEELAQKIAAQAKPGAVWLLSDFQIPETPGLRRIRAKAVLWLMYRFFRVVTNLPASRLANPLPGMERAGFRQIEKRECEHGLLYASKLVLEGP